MTIFLHEHTTQAKLFLKQATLSLSLSLFLSLIFIYQRFIAIQFAIRNECRFFAWLGVDFKRV